MNRPDEPQDQQRSQQDQQQEQQGQQQNQHHDEHHDETYNPWSIVNLVFHHLADEGLHPILGGTGDPGAPAAQLLEALGIRPAPEGNRQVSQNVQQHLAEIRTAVFGNG
jgi:hypothetical protein